MTSFGEFIKKEREKKEWTQTELGAKIGINSSAISKIEKSKKILSSSKLPRLSEIFGIDLKKISEIYFGDKFAREAYKFNCPETVFAVAEETIKYLKSKNATQGKLNF